MPSAFLPPGTSALNARLAERNARRARRVAEALGKVSDGWRYEALRALTASLAALRGPEREAFLTGPALRAWLNAAEEAILLTDPRAAESALFERIARGAHLGEILPRGRLDRRFRARAASLGRRQRQTAFLRLSPLLAFFTPRTGRFGPFPLDLAEDGEEARRKGELHLDQPVASTLMLAAGARLELAGGGIRVIQRGPAPVWTPRETIDGSGIVLARGAISTRAGLRAGPAAPGLARRLGRALALIRAAWEEGHREVIAHTRVVVPLSERGTVSFSLPDRPGVSYINVGGKSRVDLADDLLHETAHHRLHGFEEIQPLDRDDGEPRYWSPWRRSVRPVRGILHAAYTFAWRAELLARLAALPERLPRRWMERELAFEIGSLRRSLADLADARRRGLLTAAGGRLVRALHRRVERMHRQGLPAGAGGAPRRASRSPGSRVPTSAGLNKPVQAIRRNRKAGK